MSASSCPARRALRLALRAVDVHVTKSSGSPIWRNHVLSEFRRGGSGSGGGSGGGGGGSFRREQYVAAKLKMTEEYASLVNAVHAHKELLFDYGHSLDKEREQLKKATSTARFVGLEMPKLYEDEEFSKEREKGIADAWVHKTGNEE